MNVIQFIVFNALLFTTEARRRGRIVGGDIINIEDAPFIVSLEYFDRGHFCGGAILNENWVITASHCLGSIFLPSFLMVRSGAGLRARGGMEHSVRQQLRHPQFVMKVNDNDIALVMVYPKFTYSSAVKPIRLPEINSRPQVGDYVTAYGWGYTKETGDPSEYLRYVSVPVFPHEECTEIYESILNVTHQMLCAGFREGGRDACVLDSGGPMTWNGRLQGLVSWGYGCARTLRPGVYTDLSAPRIQNWITSVIQL